MAPLTFCIVVIIIVSQMIFSPWALAGEGIVGGNDSYYKGNLESRHRTENDLPVIDFLQFRRDYSDEVIFRMKKIDFIPKWGGGPFNEDYCTRYELAYLTGRVWKLLSNTFGYGFKLRPAGPRSYDITAADWGQEDVRIAIRSGLFKYHGSRKWWSKPVSSGTFMQYLVRIVKELRKFTPVVKFPLPFPPADTSAVVPEKADPRYSVIEYIYKIGLVSLKKSGDSPWDTRKWVSKREVIEAMDRIIYIVFGYDEPFAPKKSDKEYPVHRKW